MAIYSFRDKVSGEITEVSMRMSEREQYLLDHPNLEQIHLQAPSCSDPASLGIRKPAAGFRDLVSHIKKNNIRSNIKV
jgi:hypothetical protein